MQKPLAIMKAQSPYIVAITLVCATATLFAQAPQEKRITDRKAQKLAIRSPRPEYPLEARQKKITGSGVVLVRVTSAGIVSSATMFQSTGSPILDRAATSGFKHWRFRPGEPFYFRTPITFTMAGYYY